jgi:hypothetical protein
VRRREITPTRTRYTVWRPAPLAAVAGSLHRAAPLAALAVAAMPGILAHTAGVPA